MKGRGHKLWWSGKGDDVGGVGVIVKEELCKKVVEERWLTDRVIILVVVFEEDVFMLFVGMLHNVEEKQSFYDELKCEWDIVYIYIVQVI